MSFKFVVIDKKENTKYYTNMEIKCSYAGKPYVSLYNDHGKLITSPNLDMLHLFGEIRFNDLAC